MIKLYVDPVYTRIYGLSEFHEEVLNDILAFRPKGYFFTKAYKEKRWDGYVRLLFVKNGTLSTYTGLVKRIKMFLDREEEKYKIIKSYSKDKIPIDDIKLEGIDLRDYQKEVINLCKLKKRGVVQSPTGSGKTEMFIKLLGDINIPSVTVVNRTSLLGQLKEKLIERLNFRESEINIIGANQKYYNKDNYITIGTFQSLMREKYEYILKNAKMIIFDEVHHVSANELGDIRKKAKNAIICLGYSATPWREDGYDMMIESLIGPKIFNISISSLIKKGYLAKPHIYFIKTENNVRGNLSYKVLYKKLVENKIRNKNIAKCAYEFAKRNKTVLISIMRLKHIQLILNQIEEIDDVGFNIKVITGKDSVHEKVRTIKKMNTGEYNIVISTLFGEGVDVPNLDVLINARAVKSAIDAYQQAGRILRLGSEKYVIDFYDYNKVKDKDSIDYFRRYAKKRIKIYKTEPEFDVNIVDNVDEIFKEI